MLASCQIIAFCSRGRVVFNAANERMMAAWTIMEGAFDLKQVRRFEFEDEAERAWEDFTQGVPKEIIQERDYSMSAEARVGEPIPLVTPQDVRRRRRQRVA